jgi:hypothetical protein
MLSRHWSSVEAELRVVTTTVTSPGTTAALEGGLCSIGSPSMPLDAVSAAARDATRQAARSMRDEARLSSLPPRRGCFTI